MSYFIAIASNDGVNLDVSFGAAEEFIIYEVDGTTYKVKEHRNAKWLDEGVSPQHSEEKENCGTGEGCCGGGCGGGTPGPKVSLISDCRSVICKKIGLQVKKQLERKAISAFDVEMGVEEALDKVVGYIDKVDRHVSLR